MPGFGVGRRAVGTGPASVLRGPGHAPSIALSMCSCGKFSEHSFWTDVRRFDGVTEVTPGTPCDITDRRVRSLRMTDQIPEKMQAVVCHGPHDYRPEDVAVPERKPGQALIRVEAVGICAS